MTTFKVYKNNRTFHAAQFLVTAVRATESIQMQGRFGMYWAQGLEYDTNRPDELAAALQEDMDHEDRAIVSFERIS